MEKSPKNYDVLIIGAGPAGANAAISCLLYTSDAADD